MAIAKKNGNRQPFVSDLCCVVFPLHICLMCVFVCYLSAIICLFPSLRSFFARPFIPFLFHRSCSSMEYSFMWRWYDVIFIVGIDVCAQLLVPSRHSFARSVCHTSFGQLWLALNAHSVRIDNAQMWEWDSDTDEQI